MPHINRDCKQNRGPTYDNDHQSPIGAKQALSKSYEYGRHNMMTDQQSQQYRQMSSSVELSAKFQRNQQPSSVQSHHQLSLHQEEKKRASTLEARRSSNKEPRGAKDDRHQYLGSSGPLRQPAWPQKDDQNNVNQHPRGHQNPMYLTDFNNQCIQEEVEQSCSSQLTSQPAISVGAPSRELLQAFEFSFFRGVYSAYNTIWQQVLKLPIYGQNYVKRNDFIRVLQSCKVIQSDNDNIFCSFLLFSCASHLKQNAERMAGNAGQAPLLLLDFRLFLKSVFMTLKRQFNIVLSKDDKQVQSQDHEVIFHAEMFLVDHFWQFICQTEQLKPQEQHEKSRDSIRGRSPIGQQSDNVGTDRNQVESIPMDLLQKKMFEFFDRRQPPYLLQITEIEMVVTECFKNLIERNKRKDMISKRTFKKVISRQCPGILCKALSAFIPGQVSQSQDTPKVIQFDTRSNLVPYSLPLSSPVTDSGRTAMLASGPQQPKAYGMVVDHNLPSVRQQLEPKSVPRSNSLSNSNQNSNLVSVQNHRDQKSTHEAHIVDQTEQRPEKQQVDQSAKTLKDDRKSKSLPMGTRQVKRNLCKQLETKIVVKKLQSVLSSFRKRLAFAVIDLGFNPHIATNDCPSDSSSEQVQQPYHEQHQFEQHQYGQPDYRQQPYQEPHMLSNKMATGSSEEIELPIEKSPNSAARREKHIIPVQQLNQIRAKNQQLQQQMQMKAPRHDRVHTEEQHPQQNKKLVHKRGNNRDHKSVGLGKQEPQQQSMVMSTQGPHTQACTCCEKITDASGGHLLSYQEQPIGSQIMVAEIDTSSSQNQYQQRSCHNNSSTNHYQTSCFQKQASSQDQKGHSRRVEREKKKKDLQSSQDISDQKLPGDSQNVLQIVNDEASDTTGRSDVGETSEMLKNILKHETKNQQCLQQLVERVQSLEKSSKVQQRKQEFSQVQNLRDYMNQSPAAFSPTDTADGGATMTFQPDTSDRGNNSTGPQPALAQYSQDHCYGQSLHHMYEQGLPPPPQVESSQDQEVSISKQSSQNEFTHRNPDQEALLQIAHQQLEQARIQLAQLEAQGAHSQYRTSGQSVSQHSISQSISHQQSQDADLCGSTAEGYCHQQFYEKSKEEDRICKGEAIVAYDDYGDEMDFEANKEQRPLQILNNLNEQGSVPDLSAGSSFTDSQQMIQSKQTMSDPYINTNVQSLTSQSNLNPYENNPYLMTSTNSHSKSGMTSQQQKVLQSQSNGYHSQLQTNQMSEQQNLQSLSYTVSDDNTDGCQYNNNHNYQDGRPSINQNGVTKNSSIVTSAPNLMQVNQGNNILLQGTQEQIPEVPYSNRIDNLPAGKRLGNYDSHNYVSSEHLDSKNLQQSASAAELTSECHNNMASNELVYLRKYKKAKKQLKLVLRDKRDVEDRCTNVISENAILQEHLATTAQTAQEVQSHNQNIQNQFQIQKVIYALRNLARFKEKHSNQGVSQIKWRALMKWQVQAMKVSFLSEQSQQQELILSELSRHEHDFKGQLTQARKELVHEKSTKRNQMLALILNSRVRLLKGRAMTQWRINSLSSLERESTLNLQEDLSHVVTQLNQFRIELVFTKLRASLKRGFSSTLADAFKKLQGYQKARVRSSVNKPPQYKSPFMQHLIRNQSQSFTASNHPQNQEMLGSGKIDQSICTVINNTYHDSSLASRGENRPSADQYKRSKSSQSIEQQPGRSQSTSQAINSRNMGLMVSCQDNQHYQRLLTQADNSARVDHNEDVYEVHDDRPMAPRQSSNHNQRSRSDNRPVRKEDFRVKMDNRMHKMRQQGQHVDGLVKLHASFAKVSQRTKVQSRQLVFTVLLNFCISSRRRANSQERQNQVEQRPSQPQLNESQQMFPVSTSQYRSASHNPPKQNLTRSMAAISQTSSNSLNQSRYGAGISSFKISTSSLQLGSQVNKGDTPLGNKHATQQNPDIVPRERPPIATPQQNSGGEYPNLQRLRERRQMMRHQRSGSENQLEPPRIMMGMSPSMHNINGPELVKSASTMQFTQGVKIGGLSLQPRRSSIPKPKRWKP